MLCKKEMAVYCNNSMKCTSTMSEQNTFYIVEYGCMFRSIRNFKRFTIIGSNTLLLEL
jgi:hypothetical protein